MNYQKREETTEISNKNTQSTFQRNMENNSQNNDAYPKKKTISEKLTKDINDKNNMKGKNVNEEDLNPDNFTNISMNKSGKKEG